MQIPTILGQIREFSNSYCGNALTTVTVTHLNITQCRSKGLQYHKTLIFDIVHMGLPHMLH